MTSTIRLRKFSSLRKRRVPDGREEPCRVPVAGGDDGQLESLSLVLSAVGIEHCIDDRIHQLLVAEEDAESAILHLQAYQSENLYWPPTPPPHQSLHPQTPPTLLMMGMLALFFAHTGPWSAGSRWFSRGAIDSVAILDHGEWWRLVTALTLHADLMHLIGNCLIGSLMIHFLGKLVGYGVSWLLLILTGLSGNLLNILLRQQPHIAVGFSTSVFAAIGMFSGLQLVRFKAHPLKEMLLPLGAGLGLLAFLGSEGVRTDLGAHFFGFISGFGCGILLNQSGMLPKTRRPFLQAVLFLITLAIILFCWLLALH